MAMNRDSMAYVWNRLILALVVMLPVVAASASSQVVVSRSAEEYQPSFGFLRDTIYLMDTTYLEVRLDRQMIYQHFKSGRIDAYPCSTGDPRIKDAIATREGIFAIQWRAKSHFSEEFKVNLSYWMPFNGGIGFHGLPGHSYYKYLGRRPSSHGCVRISHEAGAKLFGSTQSGTVVYVHSGSPARLLQFADTALDRSLVVLRDIDTPLLGQRLDAILEQRWDDSLLASRLVIPRMVFNERIFVGNVNPRQVTQFRIPLIRISVRPKALVDRITPVPLPIVLASRKQPEE
jgi:hypothetical protein